nr:thyroglobulin type-1 repeat-containing protein [Coxiella-like endosymbiont]
MYFSSVIIFRSNVIKSTGKCWCVTLRGKEILNSRTPLGKTPDQCRLNWVYELYCRMQ